MFQRLVVFLAGVCLATVSAQTPTFRAGIDVVRIDAVVVDAKGLPIRGLKAEDFEILEEGKPRPIVGFEAIEMPAENAEPGEAAWIRAAPRDVVSRLGVNDQAAVVFSMASKKSQAFTADHARLNTAIDATSMGGTMDAGVASAWTLANAVESLKSAPQARKTLVFVSAGAAFASASLGPVMSGMETNGISGSDTSVRIVEQLNRLFADAVRAHVNVYSFDVHDFGHVTGDPPLPDVNSAPRHYLRTVADNTGGRAIIANDDPVQGVTQMFRESSEYYLLGFTSASGTPGRHRIEIRTTHPGAKVLSRKAFEIAAAETVTARKATPLTSAMAGLLPVDSLPMRVVATALPGPTTREAIVAIALGINQPADGLDGAPEKMTAQIDAYQASGKFIRATKLDAQLALKPGASGRAQYDLLGKLSLPPGRYQLRIAAHSPRFNLRGSVFADVDVPDFSRDGITVAPLVLSTSPAPPAAPANAFTGLLPVVPTSHRIFVASDRVSILARLVQGGKKPLAPVTVEVTVVDSKNRRVFGRSERLTPDSGAVNRSADYVFELPMTTLAAGDYLLTVKATLPDGISDKTLRFSRR